MSFTEHIKNHKAIPHIATDIINTPAGSISATNVQTALNELDTETVKTGDTQQGTAQITAPNSYVDVAHTLGSAPSAYAISSDTYEGAIHYEDNADGTNFRINIFNPTFNTITYKWKIWK